MADPVPAADASLQPPSLYPSPPAEETSGADLRSLMAVPLPPSAAPGTGNPFAAIDAQDGFRPAPPAKNPFAAMDAEESFAPAPATSAVGAAIHHAGTSVLPTLGALPAIGRGAAIGAEIGAFGGPFDWITVPAGTISGAVAGGMIAGGAIDWLQQKALAALPDTWQQALGIDQHQRELEEQRNPYASFVGELAPQVIAFRPGGWATAALPETASAWQRVMGHPASAHLLGGVLQGGLELGHQYVAGQSPDWSKVAIATGFGVVFNEPTRIGERLIGAGRPPTSAAVAASAPSAAEPAPVPPAPTPLADLLALRPDTDAGRIAQYNALDRHLAALIAEGAAADHPDRQAIEARLRELQPEVERLPAAVTGRDFTAEILARDRRGRPFPPPPETAPAAEEPPPAPAVEGPPVTAADWRATIMERDRRGRPFPPPPATVREEPTVAEAGDVGVMGMGDTEQTFLGSLAKSPAATAAAREARRLELSIIGPDVNEHVYDAAKRGNPELFERYEELLRQHDELHLWINEQNNPPDHLIAEAEDRRDDLQAQYEDHLAGRGGYTGGPEARRLRAQIRDAQREVDRLQERRRAYAEGRAEQTPELVQARQHLLDTQYALHDMRDEVRAALRNVAEAKGLPLEYHEPPTYSEPSAEAVRPAAVQEELPGILTETAAAGDRQAAGGPARAEQPPVPAAVSTVTAAPSAPAPARSIEDQRDFIRNDVARQLIRAGRPKEEAEAAGALIAARYETRAARLGGRAGTAEELYRSEGAEILGPGMKPKQPVAPLELLARQLLQRQRPTEPPEIRDIPGIHIGPDFLSPNELFQIKAYHGSPHDFDRFDLSKIGTGEGGQTFGHGLYFAESPEVAASYRNILSRRPDLNGPAETNAYNTLRRLAGDRQAAIDELEATAARWDNNPDGKDVAAVWRQAADLLRKGWEPPSSGRIYQVSIKADPEHFLDWDRPLGEQSEHVRNALQGLERNIKNDWFWKITTNDLQAIRRQMYRKAKTGQDILRALARGTSEADASRILREAGIPGIRYLDEGSRSAGEGTRNYVVFDDSLIEITHKDGTPVAGKDREDIVNELKQGESELMTDRAAPAAELQQPVGYHGTTHDVTDVDLEKGGSRGGIISDKGVAYFFPEKARAAHYGRNIIAKEISFDNAMTFDATALANDPAFIEEMREAFWKQATRTEELRARAETPAGQASIERQWQSLLDRMSPTHEMSSRNNLGQVRYNFAITSAILKRAREAGADVAIIKNMAEGHGPAADQILVLNRRAFGEKPEELAQPARGGIVLNPAREPGRDFLGVSDIKPILRLTKDANASTFIHESGHQFLAELLRDAEHEAAPAQLKADARTALAWLGAENAGNLQRKHHEQFARGFEQYLREGTAPSAGLARVFAQFRQWLLAIYETLKGLGKPISEDIRGVFDRLLAEEPQRPVNASEPAPAPARSIEDQRDFIRNDVARQLIRAGRPKEEADAIGALLAARYEFRANLFKGALGTPEELYRREAPEILGSGKRSQQGPPSAPRPRVIDATKLSLIPFLAHRGGLRRVGDLEAILGKRPFVPGFGPLFHDTGMTLDRAREAAEEAGYIDPVHRHMGGGGYSDARTTINDLLEAINDEARGNKRYRKGYQPPPQKMDPDYEQYLREQAELEAAELQYPPTHSLEQENEVFFQGDASANLANAEEFKRKVEALGPEYEVQIQPARGGSVYARIFRWPVNKDGTRARRRKAGSYAHFEARFADHGSYHFNSISVDPIGGNTVDKAVEVARYHLTGEGEPPTFKDASIDPATGEHVIWNARYNRNAALNDTNPKERFGIPQAPPAGDAFLQSSRQGPGDISAGPYGQTMLFQQDRERWAANWRGLFTAPRDAASRMVLRRSYVLEALTGHSGPVRFLPLRARAKRIKHPDIPDDVWSNLPALIANPRLAYPYGDLGTINVVINATTKKGEPIIVGIRPDGEIHTITPRHDTEDATGQEQLAGIVRAAIKRRSKVYIKDASVAAAIEPAASGSGMEAQRRSTVSRGANPPYPSGSPDRQSLWRPPRNVLTFDDVVQRQGRVFYQRHSPEEPLVNSTGYVLRLPYFERWGDPRHDPEDAARALTRLREIADMNVRQAPWDDVVQAKRDIDEIFAQLYFYKADVPVDLVRKYIRETEQHFRERKGTAGDEKRSILSDVGETEELSALAEAGRRAFDNLLRSRRRGIVELLRTGMETAGRRAAGPQPASIGETQRSGFYFPAGRLLAEVPEALFSQGGWAVINWLRQAGVSQAEIRHFELDTKLGNQKPVTREDFASAIASRMFDFRRKTSWLNPERSPRNYKMGGTRAFTGPRIPGRGIYFERLMAFPKRLSGGEAFAPGSFESPHWGETMKGVWASWRGSVREVPGWGRMVVGEEGQSDFMHGASTGRRPWISKEEYLTAKKDKNRYQQVISEASELLSDALSRVGAASGRIDEIKRDLLRPEISPSEWKERLDAVREEALGRDATLDAAARQRVQQNLDALETLRRENERFFVPGAHRKYLHLETTFTPETPINESYVRVMVRDLLLHAAKEDADSIAIATSETTARIQNKPTAAHFYDRQLKPALERELRRLTGDGSITLEKLALPKAQGAPVREKPYTVWAAKLPEEAKRQIEGGASFFQRISGKYEPVTPQDRARGLRPIVRLTRFADASTPIHEIMGHGFLDELSRDARREDAPQWLRDDFQAFLDWLGAESADELFETNDRDRFTPRAIAHQEKFARGMEAFVMEGRAPTPALARIFALFRDWLMRVYHNLQALEKQAGFGIELTDRIREAYGRLLTDRLDWSSEPTVITPEREPVLSHGREWQSDAAVTQPDHADAAEARVEEEQRRRYEDIPDEILAELHAQEARFIAEHERISDLGGAPGQSPRGPGEVDMDRSAAGPQPGGGSGGAGAGGRITGEGAPPPEGDRLPELGPAGERPGDEGQDGGNVPPSRNAGAGTTGSAAGFNPGKYRNVRVENITSVEQFVRQIDEAAERIPSTTDVLTGGELFDARDEWGLTQNDISIDEMRDRLGRAFGGVVNLGKKIALFRQAVRDQAEKVHDLMSRVQAEGAMTGIVEYAYERQKFDMMMSVLSSVTTEWGRSGRAFRNLEDWDRVRSLVSGDRILSAEEQSLVDSFVKSRTGRSLYQLKMEAKLGSRLDSHAKIAKFLREAQHRTFGGMLLEYWVNALISGPATHGTYLIGNQITKTMEATVDTLLASGISRLRAALGRPGERIYAGEALQQVKAIVDSLPKSLQGALEALKAGQPTLLPGQEAVPLTPWYGDTQIHIARNIQSDFVTWREFAGDLFAAMRGLRDGIVGGAQLIAAGGTTGAPLMAAHWSPTGQIPDVAILGVPAIPVGSLFRAPGRLISAIHSFDVIQNYERLIAARAYRDGVDQGLSGEKLTAHIAARRQEPPQAWMEHAHKESYAATLMASSGSFVSAFSRLVNVKADLPFLGETRVLKFIDPFVHIGANIINKAVVERTPLGILSRTIRDDLLGRNGNVAQDYAMARMLAGTALSLVFGSLAMEGYVTGSGPKDSRQAAMWRQVYQPHSVRIGDMWYQVNRLGPMGMLLGIAADMYGVAHEASEHDMLTAAAHFQHAVTQNILDESFMRGPADLIRAVEEPGRYGEGYLRNFASSFVPFSVGMYQIARASDPYAREARTVMDAIIQKLPGKSQELPPRISVWGEPVPNPDALGHAGLTSIYEKKANADPVDRALLDLGIYPALPEKKIRNVELTPQEYEYYCRIAGRYAKQQLDAIVLTPGFQRMPPFVRQKLIRQTIESTRESARGAVMARFPHIPRDAVLMRRDQAAGTSPALH